MPKPISAINRTHFITDKLHRKLDFPQVTKFLTAFRNNAPLAQHDVPDYAARAMISLTSSIGRVRLVGIIEGISFLLLLGVAMPLKYAFDMPEAVRVVGMIHGVLFVAFSLVLLLAWIGGALNFRWTLIAFLATLLPFGPFLIDRRLAALEKSAD